MTVAALESTSTYWKAPFYCLEEVMEVWLLNALHIKAVPGRKTDVKDAEWIAQLLEHGLVRRCSSRRRTSGICGCCPLPGAADGRPHPGMTRLELMLEGRLDQVSSVAASLTSVSARAMLAALIAGERDPRVLAGWPRARCG